MGSNKSKEVEEVEEKVLVEFCIRINESQLTKKSSIPPIPFGGDGDEIAIHIENETVVFHALVKPDSSVLRYRFHVCSVSLGGPFIPDILPTYMWGRIGFNDLSAPVSAPIDQIRQVDGKVSISLSKFRGRSDEKTDDDEESVESPPKEQEEFKD